MSIAQVLIKAAAQARQQEQAHRGPPPTASSSSSVPAPSAPSDFAKSDFPKNSSSGGGPPSSHHPIHMGPNTINEVIDQKRGALMRMNRNISSHYTPALVLLFQISYLLPMVC